MIDLDLCSIIGDLVGTYEELSKDKRAMEQVEASEEEVELSQDEEPKTMDDLITDFMAIFIIADQWASNKTHIFACLFPKFYFYKNCVYLPSAMSC